MKSRVSVLNTNTPRALEIALRFGRGFARSLFTVVLLFSGMQPTFVEARGWYVRQGATGSNNGTDWNNAWTNVTSINWSSVAASDTVWIAGGQYGVLTIGKSGTTNAPLYIARVRSTNTAAVAAAGWNPAFDSTVTLPRVVGTGYNWWILDGQIPHGGIVVSNPSVSVGHGIELGSTSFKSVTLRNLMISGSVTDTNVPGVGDMRCINYNGYYQPSSSGLTIQYCTLQQYPTLISTININEILIEHCKFMKNHRGATTIHPNVWQVIGATNVVFRFNEITEYLAEGIMMDFISTNDAACDNWDVYGNVWHNSVPGWYGRVLESQKRSQTRIRVYNNTFVNLDFTVRVAEGGSWGSGCSLMNNIIYNCGVPGSFGQGADDYNACSQVATGAHTITNLTSSIFVNYAAKDYRIVGTTGSAYPKDKGVSLGPTYTMDCAGNTRGADGAWDIGAYEFQSGATSTPPAIAVTPAQLAYGSIVVGTTSDLTFTVQNTGGGSLSGSASVSAPFSILSGGTYTLASNQTHAVTVRYSPTAAVGSTQSVSFTGGTGTVTRTVTGSAFNAPAAAVTPASLDFGSIEAGTTADLTFTVQNSGGGTLSGSASVSAPFSIVSGGSYSLAGSQSQVVTVRYSPTVAGSSSQNVSFAGGTGAVTRAVSGAATVTPPPPPTGLRVVTP